MASQCFINFAALVMYAHLNPAQFAEFQALHLKHGKLPAQPKSVKMRSRSCDKLSCKLILGCVMSKQTCDSHAMWQMLVQV